MKSSVPLIIFVLVVFTVTFIVAVLRESTPAYALAGISFVIFVALYAAEVLNYQVGGRHITLQKQVKALETDTKELKLITTALVKSSFVITSGVGRFQGARQHQEDLLREYFEPVAHLFEENIPETVSQEIEARYASKT